MQLTLIVVSHQSERLGDASAFVFDERGGVIGRDRQADWHIDDPAKELSSRHARIWYVDQQFCIEDTSTNGTALGQPDQMIPKEQVTPLRDGDMLYLGDFEILVQVISDPEPAPVPLPPPVHRQAAPVPPTGPSYPVPGHGDEQPIVACGKEMEWPPTVPPLPPAVNPPPPRPVGSQPPPRLPASAGAGLEALYAELGLDPRLVPPETAAQLGTILRTVTQGLVEVMQARAEVKNQFKITTTQLRAVENNPLKVAYDYQQAMHMLFLARNPGYLGPIEAFSEALEDLRNHELAVLAGMQAAFRVVVERFNPEQIERNLKSSGRAGGLFDGGGKGRAWDYFREMYALTAKDPDSAFAQLFAPAFIKAYEDQIRRLKTVPQARR